jgi:TusA-related sulfurtransferase
VTNDKACPAGAMRKNNREHKMKFVNDKKADESLDLVCRMCPMHLLEPGDRLKCMKKGQVLEVLTDYDGALEDIPDWCKKCGHEFIGMEEDDDYYKFYIKKQKDET